MKLVTPRRKPRQKVDRQERRPDVEQSGNAATIRAARVDDIPELIEMGRAAFAQSGDETLMDFDNASFATSASSLISITSAGLVLVAQSQAGQLVGMIGCVFFPYYLNSQTWISQEIFSFVKAGFSGGAELTEEMDRQAAMRGAHLFLPATTLRGARLYTRHEGDPRRLSS